MFKLSKSNLDSDFENSKKDVQHKVLCDWLRNIQQQNVQIARKLTLVQRTIDSLLEDEPRQEEIRDFDDK